MRCDQEGALGVETNPATCPASAASQVRPQVHSTPTPTFLRKALICTRLNALFALCFLSSDCCRLLPRRFDTSSSGFNNQTFLHQKTPLPRCELVDSSFNLWRSDPLPSPSLWSVQHQSGEEEELLGTLSSKLDDLFKCTFVQKQVHTPTFTSTQFHPKSVSPKSGANRTALLLWTPLHGPPKKSLFFPSPAPFSFFFLSGGLVELWLGCHGPCLGSVGSFCETWAAQCGIR